LRAGDAAFRIGGDEFALLLPETTAEQAAIVVDRVAPGVPHATQLAPRLSCGVAAAPADGIDAETLISRADSALYAVKLARQP
jgi:diguanylate cyclase (GGDEF)-like protein